MQRPFLPKSLDNTDQKGYIFDSELLHIEQF